MSYKKGDPEVYLVTWPDHLIIKAGVTDCARWRNFVARGALLLDARLDLRPWRLETDLERCLSDRLPRAFRVREDAAPWLGNRGGGYLECYRAPSGEALEQSIAACMSIMRTHHASASAARWSTDGRTDVPTKMHPTFRIEQDLRNARAGVGDDADGVGR